MNGRCRSSRRVRGRSRGSRRIRCRRSAVRGYTTRCLCRAVDTVVWITVLSIVILGVRITCIVAIL